jgi:uncharacterized membrane protein (DUF2068 family)
MRAPNLPGIPPVMTSEAATGEPAKPPPGTERPRRFRPRLRYELVGCGLHGHELLGTDAAEIRAADQLVVRDAGGGLRWYRCLRCDSWLPLPAPEQPGRTYLPDRDDVQLPLRGKPLRDKYVLRLIAIDRFLHFVVLGAIAVAIFVFLRDRAQLHHAFLRITTSLQGGFGGPSSLSRHGILGDLQRAFNVKAKTLWTLGLIVTGYAVLEGVEGVGLWLGKRWAEYLTLIATTILLIPEVYELTGRLSVTKILALIINVAVVVYLLFAKRLFGLRGGGRAEQAERERDIGWDALERALPAGHPADTGAAPSSR